MRSSAVQGYLAIVLHAHLPFVRHPEHERSLEESWLFEAIIETYIPLLRNLQRWQNECIFAPLTLTLTPTLCAMLGDALLQERFSRHLNDLIELTGKEIHRTLWEPKLHQLANFYHARLLEARDFYHHTCHCDLVSAFRRLQEAGAIEIITSAATHAVLPLLLSHPPSLRAQLQVACDDYRRCFGRKPRGIWLPECAYSEGLEPFLKEAGLQWYIVETHGLLHARPKPLFGNFAPIITPGGLAAAGRDQPSAKQVWSRYEGYPGDVRYRDFYRDIGFDLDLDYLASHLPVAHQRTFTGIKYHRVTGNTPAKALYERPLALKAADEHADHFLHCRIDQITKARELLGRQPLVLSPYDAELFGHWWFEAPEFLDLLVRKAYYDQKVLSFTTPGSFLIEHPTHQLATPAASSWGERGYWRMWLNEKTDWIYGHLKVAQERMTGLASHANTGPTETSALKHRAICQAGRELLLAQASDWPFIIQTGTSPDYARDRIRTHLSRFNRLYQESLAGTVDTEWLGRIEAVDNLFPSIDPQHWKA